VELRFSCKHKFAEPLRFPLKQIICSCEHTAVNKRPGSFTAERVLRTRPKTYRAIVRLLAEPDRKDWAHRPTTPRFDAHRARNQTKRGCRTSRAKTTAGVDLWQRCGNRSWAHGRTRRESNSPRRGRDSGNRNRQAARLLGETDGGVPVQINLHTGVAELLHKRYNELVEAAESEVALLSGGTISQHGAQITASPHRWVFAVCCERIQLKIVRFVTQKNAHTKFARVKTSALSIWSPMRCHAVGCGLGRQRCNRLCKASQPTTSSGDSRLRSSGECD